MSALRFFRWPAAAIAVAVLSACQAAPDGHEPLAPAMEPQLPVRATTLGGHAKARYDTLPPLPTARIGHGLVVYRDCIWAIGGEVERGGPATSAVDRYCPHVDSTRWRPAPPLPEAAAYFAGVAVIGDRIYVAGGVNAAGETLRSVYAFEAGRGWSRMPEPMPFRVACGGGTVVDERLYVYGGAVDLSYGPGCLGFKGWGGGMLIFDPKAATGRQWSQAGDSPVGTPCGYRLTSVDQTVYVVGGAECGFDWPSMYPYEFDTQARLWRPTTTSISLLFWPGVARVGTFLVTYGGRNGDLWYNPSDMVFAGGGGLGGGGPLPSLPDGLLDAPAVGFRGDLVIAGGMKDATYRAIPDVTRLHLSNGCDLYESDDRVADAASLPVILDRDAQLQGWSTTLGRICHRDDVDHIRLLGFLENVEAGGVRLTPPPGTDYRLTILDSAGTRVLARSARAGSVTESLPIPTSASSFLLRIESQDGTFDPHRPYEIRLVR